MSPTFDVEVTRDVDPTILAWPRGDEADDDSGLGGNRAYSDLRGMSWDDVTRVLALEAELSTRLDNADDPDEEYDLIDDELFDSDDGLFGLDIGVASTVIALSAAECLPFSSCNAGAYGGSHHETHPLVAFFAQPVTVPILLSAATRADVGLDSDPEGFLLVYSDEIAKMPVFASYLHAERDSLNKANQQPAKNSPKNDSASEQAGFGLD